MGLRLRSFPSEGRRPRDTRVIAQPTGDDLDSLGRAGHGVVFRGFDDDGHHVIFEGIDDAAAQDDAFGIDEIDDISDRDSGVFGGFFDDLFDELIAFAQGLTKVPAAQVVEIIPKHIDQDGFLAVFDRGLNASEDRGATGEGFEAAAIAATALRAADLDDHVTDFTCGAVEAAEQFAVQDDARTNPGAEEDADDMARFGAEFGHMNAERAGVAVVLDVHGDFEVFLEFLFEGDGMNSLWTRCFIFFK